MNEPTRTIYLLRHGETEWNVARRIQGHLDSPLTERGRAQAHRMGTRLLGLLADPSDWRIVASPLGRALSSARIVAGVLGAAPSSVSTDDRLMEVTTGQWDGRFADDVVGPADSPRQDVNHGRIMLDSPTGESYADVAARLRSWLDDVAWEPRLVVVAHGAVGKVLRGLWLGLPEDATACLDAPQDAFFRLTRGQAERIACDMAPGDVL